VYAELYAYLATVTVWVTIVDFLLSSLCFRRLLWKYVNTMLLL